MTLCTVLKSFPFSRDGIATEHAVKGSQADIPDALVPGLSNEGYVSVGATKHVVQAPETKAVSHEPDDLSGLRDQYQETVGKRPYHGWDADTLRAKIAEAE